MMPINSFHNNAKLNVVVGVFGAFILLMIGYSMAAESENALPKDAGEKSSVVATVGEHTIRATDFNGYLAERPISPRSPSVKEDVAKRLEDLILEEVLYQEALRLKLDQDPEIRRRIRQMLNQKLIEQQVIQKEWNREIAGEELRSYYDAHLKEFNRPAQVRVADIFIAVPAGAGDKDKAELGKKAQSVLAEALAARNRRAGFGKMVAKYSDKPEKYRKGDSGYFDIEGQPVGVDRNLARAAFKLNRVGSVANEVIETAQGYHVKMLIGKRAAINTPLKSIEKQLEQRMRRESVAKARRDYLHSLQRSTDIKIQTSVLTGIVEELSQPAAAKKPPARTTQATTRGKRMPTPPPLPGQ